MTGRELAEAGEGPPPSPAVSGPATSSRGSRPERSALSSRYRSLFVLGRGGMGTVEAALEIEPASSPGSPPQSYERVVALKRLLPDSVHDKRRVEMFLREARLATMLDHPNVVRAFDYGEIEGELYLAMEYVDGQPLSRLLKALEAAGQRMTPATAGFVLAEICRGLHAAHELADPATGASLQLVHRDVSPHNVMIGYDGRVRLLDFGVAKIEAESVTKTGEVKGKTAYMSPEQAMGDRLDRRSDLFSVGAVLYECLTLRRMWGDGTDMEVIRRLALESPPTLDEGGEIPSGMRDLHARLVAREAKDRPSTAKEVADELMTFVDDPSGAADALRTILSTHFAEDARARRAQLAAALEEVAPEQADELRESVLPESALASLKLRAVAKAADAVPAEDARPAPAKRRPVIAIGVAAIAVVGVVGWKIATASAGANAEAPATAAPSSTGTGSTGTAAGKGAAAPTATATGTGTGTGTGTAMVVTPSATISASATATSTGRVARPIVTAVPRPVSSAKAPDLDEKPF